ncbi:MAG: thiamine-phosphate kinase, partial [Thermoplasmata archaeon]
MSPDPEQAELSLLRRIREMLPPAPPGEVWIGDDAAVLPPPHGELLLAIDSVGEGVHVDLGLVGASDVGWRAVSTNLSDIAAMGGWPWRVVASVAAPPGTDVEALCSGMAEATARYGCPLVGGDLVTSATLVVSVAITGTTEGEPPVLRSGARAGDAVFVTGPLGGSAAGLRVLRS